MDGRFKEVTKKIAKHVDAQAKRIAELEAERVSMIGEMARLRKVANECGPNMSHRAEKAESKVAELEATVERQHDFCVKKELEYAGANGGKLKAEARCAELEAALRKCGAECDDGQTNKNIFHLYKCPARKWFVPCEDGCGDAREALKGGTPALDALKEKWQREAKNDGIMCGLWVAKQTLLEKAETIGPPLDVALRAWAKFFDEEAAELRSAGK